MRQSARHLDGFPVNRQGRGLLDMQKAWNILSSSASRPKPYEIETSSSVTGDLQQFTATPGSGPGFYEREGWKPGDSGVRTITFLRKSGPASPVTATLRGVGNDGTFTSNSSVTLPLDKPVDIPVRIHTLSAGMHSAILQIVDSQTGVVEKDLEAAVVAADTVSQDHPLKAAGTLPYISYQSFFVNVPPGTRSLHIHATEKSAVRMVVRTRIGSEQDDHRVDNMPQIYYRGMPSSRRWLVDPDAPLSESFPDPQPGVWEITIENPAIPDMADLPHSDAQFSLSASVEPYGEFTAPLQSVPVVAGQRAYIEDLTVAPDTKELRVKTTLAHGSTGDIVNLYLYDCTRDNHCYLWNLASSHYAEQQLTAEAPPPGKWKALIDVVQASPGSQILFGLEAK